MSKYFQREFVLPLSTIIMPIVAGFLGYDLSTEQLGVLAGLCATGVSGILLRKSIMGPQRGAAKYLEREFWIPLCLQIWILIDRIFALGMDEKTMLWLAGGVAGIIISLIASKTVRSKRRQNHEPS